MVQSRESRLEPEPVTECVPDFIYVWVYLLFLFGVSVFVFGWV